MDDRTAVGRSRIFWHVTAINQSNDSINQSNCRTVVTWQKIYDSSPPVRTSMGACFCKFSFKLHQWVLVISMRVSIYRVLKHNNEIAGLLIRFHPFKLILSLLPAWYFKPKSFQIRTINPHFTSRISWTYQSRGLRRSSWDDGSMTTDWRLVSAVEGVCGGRRAVGRTPSACRSVSEVGVK